MALKSTIFKAALQLADIDHHCYGDHALTLARHPSETDERMMVRVAAWALHAHAVDAVCHGDGTLAFGGGLSDPDQPDLALNDYTGRTRLWIEVGQPDEKTLSRAASRADAVVLYAYSSAADVWWRTAEPALARQAKVQVWRLPAEQTQALAELAERTMALQATLHDGVLTISSDRGSVSLEPQRWK